MSRPICHNCNYSNYLIVLQSGVTKCPRCNCIFGSETLPIPTKIQSRVVIPAKIDMHTSLSLLSAQLIATYIGKGLTTAEVANQLGITKATVYAKLRKHHMLDNTVSDHPTINVTSSDLYVAGWEAIAKPKTSVTPTPISDSNQTNRAVTQKGAKNV